MFPRREFQSKKYRLLILDSYPLLSKQVQRGGLAVSSTIKRQWQKNGATHHHIIDPSLGASSQSGVASVYAKAPTVLIADTLATVLIVNPSLKQKLERYFSAQVIIVYFDQLP